MVEAPDAMLCTKTHEYVIPEGNTAKVGITDYAIHQLGDIVFVELPEVGSTFSKGQVFGTIESVKAASELYMPVGGKVAEINEKLLNQPELINEDCYGEGWLIKISDTSSDELKELMNCKDYKQFIEQC